MDTRRGIPPAGLCVTATHTHALTQSMAIMGYRKRFFGFQRPLPFRFLAVKDRGSTIIRLYFAVPTLRTTPFQAAFSSAYPDVHLIPEKSSPIPLPPTKVTMAKSIQSGGHGLYRWLPLAMEHVIMASDPLNVLLSPIGEHPEAKRVVEVWMRLAHEQHFGRMIGSKIKQRKPGSGISEYFSPRRSCVRSSVKRQSLRQSAIPSLVRN
ncbi:MAG: hypothetical protein OWS03_04385 [Alicyclobacillaceae bacterium]|nr:hypothetical protein [Alicyclobacillaceae bacterium]